MMSTYRSLAARQQNVRVRTQGKIDRQLERLSERIGEALGELTNYELMALTCWQDGIIAGTYEVDHAELTTRPYVSIRRIDRWTEEYSLEELKEMHKNDTESQTDISATLRGFLNQLE